MFPSSKIKLRVNRLRGNLPGAVTSFNKSAVSIISIKSKRVSESPDIWTTVKNWININLGLKTYDKIPNRYFSNTSPIHLPGELLSFSYVKSTTNKDYALHQRIANEYPTASYIISDSLVWIDSIYFNEEVGHKFESEFKVLIIPAGIQLYWR